MKKHFAQLVVAQLYLQEKGYFIHHFDIVHSFIETLILSNDSFLFLLVHGDIIYIPPLLTVAQKEK